jgi:hypothetical protein
VSRTSISHTLFSKGKVGTCHDLPPKTEDFDAAAAANEVLALEDSIKRYCAVRAHWHADTQAPAVCLLNLTPARWRHTFKTATGRAPSAGDMVNDVQVTAMLEKRRRLQGEAL